jgi:hypothetical protein
MPTPGMIDEPIQDHSASDPFQESIRRSFNHHNPHDLPSYSSVGDRKDTTLPGQPILLS